MKKLIATISVITALGAGAFALNAVLPAGASITAVTQTASSSANGPSPKCEGPRAKFKGVLDGLVQDGTIDQTQEDKIIEAFKDAAPANKPRSKGFERGRPVLKGMLDTAATAIGVSDADLVTASKIVYLEGYLWDPPHAKQAFLRAAKLAHEAGHKVALSLSDSFCVDRADKMKSRLSDAATKFVNHTRPAC